jgi:predicted lipid-binding transport protein (Tim44 family)
VVPGLIVGAGAGIMRTMTTLAVFRLGPAACGALLCVLSLHGPTALADEAGALQRCRAIGEPQARLACYDALPLRAPAAAAATPPPAPAAATRAAVPAPAAAATAAPAPVPAPAAQRFGQESRDEPQALVSRIPGVFEGWGPRSRITLANGQVWQVIDGSEGVYLLQNPQVTVRRAMLGGFVLEIEGANRAPRVRRVD